MNTFLNPDFFRFLSLTLFPVVIIGVLIIILQLLRKKQK